MKWLIPNQKKNYPFRPTKITKTGHLGTPIKQIVGQTYQAFRNKP